MAILSRMCEVPYMGNKLTLEKRDEEMNHKECSMSCLLGHKETERVSERTNSHKTRASGQTM